MKRQNIPIYFFINLLIPIFFSCEDVIKLDLENAEPKIVIESVISEGQDFCKVRLSKTADFYSEGGYESIHDARIILSDNKVIDTLEYQGNGSYISHHISGIQGNTYHLQVLTDNRIYTATNTIPQKTELDSLSYEWAENPHNKGYMVNLFFQDAPEIKNYYRVKIYVSNIDGHEQPAGQDYILFDDKIFDGKKTNMPAKHGGKFFNENDTIKIELYSLSKETYDYYNTLKGVSTTSEASMERMGQSMMEGSASAPANPATNFNNGALGYFGAYCVSDRTIIIR